MIIRHPQMFQRGGRQVQKTEHYSYF